MLGYIGSYDVDDGFSFLSFELEVLTTGWQVCIKKQSRQNNGTEGSSVAIHCVR
jgi:hypothetical protein